MLSVFAIQNVLRMRQLLPSWRSYKHERLT